MAWFRYWQNNSGGFYVGEHTTVFIEAPDAANFIAESKTCIYFNGVEAGMDCECCGDRWYSAWECDGKKEPPEQKDGVLIVPFKRDFE